MNNTPLISVAIATYNGEQFLRDQLDSIYNQTYRNIEVIVTDDCSTDRTANILDEYRLKYGLEYHVNEKNLGHLRNFERAVSFCNGDYIALADQDDIWLPDKIERLRTEIRNYSLVFSDAIVVDTNGNRIADSMKKICRYIADTETPFLHLFYRKFVYGCTMLFKKELLEQALPIPKGIAQHDWWLPIVAAKNGGIKYVDQSLMLYRQHSNNVSGHVKEHDVLYKFLKSFSRVGREKRKWYRRRIKKDIESSLTSGLSFHKDERATLADIINYLESFLKNELNMNVLKVGFKNRDVLFSKRSYFFLEMLYRFVYKALNL